jgi:hypothetical protein
VSGGRTSIRVFFSSGRSHIEEVEQLLEELPDTAVGGAGALLDLVATRVEAIFGPTFCVVYWHQGDGFEPACVAGDARPQPLSSESTRVVRGFLARRIGPMRFDRRGRRREDPAIAEGVRAALHALDAALLVPVRPQGALEAFLCLGPKRSGDVYTPTDLTLLASVAHHASEELPPHGER